MFMSAPVAMMKNIGRQNIQSALSFELVQTLYYNFAHINNS